LIHAARVPDERPEALEARKRFSKDGLETAQLLGGIVGAGELTALRVYRGVEEFKADQPHHLNHPSWFEPPRLFGFVFDHLTVLPFLPCPGQTRLFKTECKEEAVPKAGSATPILPSPNLDEERVGEERRPQLIVSVRSADEVEAAFAGGADLIDVKEPDRGPLGPADWDVLTEAVAAVARRCPVSAALGELLDSFWKEPPFVSHLAYAKWGLAGFQRHAPLLWRWELTYATQRLAEVNPGCRAVAVAYADWKRAQAPPPDEVLSLAASMPLGAFLIDTWAKDGSTLLDWLPLEKINELRQRCRTAGLPMALAGSLGPAGIQTLLPVRPDWFAVRGAVCRGRQRGAAVEEVEVRRLAALLGRNNA
jgi:uncharacterized protein (UPF0264 family)